jgi:heparan-alpha-glucosaminide N-acetyltransferase
MTTIDDAVSVRAESETAPLRGSSRILSIDIFRGLTMAVMIFVNALASVPGLPWWTYHAHANEDVMTYVDMVFPFFLFIVGMSLPLSVAQRLKRDPSLPALWLHVVLRSASLIGLGLILANAEKADASRMGISGDLWALLGLLSGALYLNVYPPAKLFPAYSTVLRGIGLAGVVILFAIFRRTTHSGSVAWIDPSYPEILGLIGFSYLAVSFLYIPARRWRWAPAIWFLAMLGLCIVSTAKLITGPNRWPIYFWPFSNGSMACIVMAGVVTSQIFLGTDRRPVPKRAMSIATGFGILALIAGWVCTPLGISKIRATPTWSLYSIGASILLFTVLYWICDVKRLTSWAFPVRAAGANTLLTYLLPDLWYFLFAAMGITYLDTHLAVGWPAVVKTAAFTVLMLGLASVLTKARVRLQL